MNKAEILVDELHKPARRVFPRRSVVVSGVDDVWAMDTVVMATTEREVDLARGSKKKREKKIGVGGYKNILVVIDVLSKFVWAKPMKSGQAAEVKKCVEQIISESDRSPNKIWVDEGREFAKLLSGEFGQVYHTFKSFKSMIAERVIRTLKSWMWREFTRRKELGLKPVYNWVEDLPSIVDKYNNTVHRTIGMTPKEAVGKESELMKMQNQRASQPRGKKSGLKLGDFVRLVKAKGMLAKEKKFRKGFGKNWSRVVYRIVGVVQSSPPMYRLMDVDGEMLKSSFYAEEIQKTKLEPKVGSFYGTGLTVTDASGTGIVQPQGTDVL